MTSYLSCKLTKGKDPEEFFKRKSWERKILEDIHGVKISE